MPRSSNEEPNESAIDPAMVDAIPTELAAADVDADGEEDEDAELAEDMASFALTVGTVADYLEDNAEAVFENAIGTPMDPDDPLLEKLVLGAFTRRFIDSLHLEWRRSGRRKGDLDKLVAARSLVDEAVVSALRHFSGGKLKEIAWHGADDEQLLAFAYAVAAAWQVGATADALLDMEFGLDPEKMEELTAMLEAFAEQPGLLAEPDGDEDPKPRRR